MKHSFLLAAMTLILLAGCKSNNTKPADEGVADNANTATATQTDDASYTGPKRYPIKSGIIEYQVTGVQTAKWTVYFDDHGMKEARYFEPTTKVNSKNNRDLQILNGDTLWLIKLNEKTGSKQIKPAFMFQVFTDSVLLTDGYVKTGTGTVAGKECITWTKKKIGSTSWIWQGIILKQETTTGDRLTYSATSVQENVPIPAGKFVIPEDITLTADPSLQTKNGK